MNPAGNGVCDLCPRRCGVRRVRGETGYCRAGTGWYIASICAHRGEEPAISGTRGICNVFFAHCNLQCVYCQNYQISSNSAPLTLFETTLEETVGRISSILKTSEPLVGFVSASHCVPQIKSIISRLHDEGIRPAFLYNTNSYDRVDVLRGLEDEIDVYLPDFKYAGGELAAEYSGAGDYPETAIQAIAEMVRQKGAELQFNEDGVVNSGVVVRHLVLPGAVENSKRCLRMLAERVSPDVHVSLMSQYTPVPRVSDHPLLGRRLRPEEYNEVVSELRALGFENGWVQAMDSAGHFLPDFKSSGTGGNGRNPFGGELKAESGKQKAESGKRGEKPRITRICANGEGNRESRARRGGQR
ncbi:MAG: radical SAM protein [Kiritimatiellia bacterium]